MHVLLPLLLDAVRRPTWTTPAEQRTLASIAMNGDSSKTDNAVKERVQTRKQEPTRYKVILLNDDYTTDGIRGAGAGNGVSEISGRGVPDHDAGARATATAWPASIRGKWRRPRSKP
jgi:hypothetical protein